MQQGEVDPYLRPLMRLILRGAEGTEETIEAHFDTGFNRSLAVPLRIISALQLPHIRNIRMTLAMGVERISRSIRVVFSGRVSNAPYVYLPKRVRR